MLNLPAPLVLRPMVEADLTAVTAIENASMPTPTSASVYLYEITQNKLAHYHVLACPQPIGYAGYWLLGDEAHVSIIAVHPKMRGRGFGELLFLHMTMLARANGAREMTLEVRRSNTTAQALYQKYQLAVVGERTGYYKKTGEDALIMTSPPMDEAYGRFLQTQQEKMMQKLAIEITADFSCIT
ncbi:MAG: ribosomal protein S18-alanine N-acetyltransferase [Candidatus Promineifilaceae bacterium]